MKPQKEIMGLTFFPVPNFDQVTVTFGANRSQFFDRYDRPKVPSIFEDIAQSLFYGGGPLPKLHPSVDKQKAQNALRAWLVSFAPAHEAKITTVAYALWLWTDPEALDSDND
jgi:hypothetical protein